MSSAGIIFRNTPFLFLASLILFCWWNGDRDQHGATGVLTSWGGGFSPCSLPLEKNTYGRDLEKCDAFMLILGTSVSVIPIHVYCQCCFLFNTWSQTSPLTFCDLKGWVKIEQEIGTRRSQMGFLGSFFLSLFDSAKTSILAFGPVGTLRADNIPCLYCLGPEYLSRINFKHVNTYFHNI